MDNNMFCKPQYKCSICGKVYDKAIDRANCELNCYKKQQEEEYKAAEAKKAAEKDARKKEVDEAFKNAAKLPKDYTRDYGIYDYDNKYKSTNNLWWPTSYWDYFL